MKKIAVVTGATSGIGLANTELLLKKGYDVLGVARSLEKAESLKTHISSLQTTGTLKIVMGNLGSIKETRELIEKIKHLLDKHYDGCLDVLMNIAGIVSSGLKLTLEGHELTFQTNHVSVFMLTTELIPYLKKATNPKVLVVSSLSHYRASFNPKNIENKKCYNILKAYKRSKLYNVLFVKAFHRKYDIPIFAIDPGLVKTEIGLKNTSKLEKAIWSWRVSKGTDAYYPARFMVDIADDDTYIKDSGSYFKEGKLKPSNPNTYRIENQELLWQYTEKLLK